MPRAQLLPAPSLAGFSTRESTNCPGRRGDAEKVASLNDIFFSDVTHVLTLPAEAGPRTRHAAIVLLY
jgi:hypothetical protein